MYKKRILEQSILKAIKTFPAILITGPRQSGKTTLLKMLFGNSHSFVSLEDPNTRIRAKEDPIGFLATNPPPIIIDEIQYVPELLSYIKTKIDENRIPGQWLFTGSQHFALMQGVGQSLAGRVAVLTLLPFSLPELAGLADDALDIPHWLSNLDAPVAPHSEYNLEDMILRGGYPELASNLLVDRLLWCGSYIATYLERDIRNLAHVGDLGQFERFLKLCATRTGQILNVSELARDVGTSVPTARRWLSVLEAGQQIVLLAPYYRNIGKRLIKSPKLYFIDTALASYLLGINDARTLMNSPHLGNLFESMVITELYKRFLHFGQLPSLYYIRTRDGLEVDCMIDMGDTLHLFEIKSSGTILSKHATSLVRLRSALGSAVGISGVISTSPDNYRINDGVTNYSWGRVLIR